MLANVVALNQDCDTSPTLHRHGQCRRGHQWAIPDENAHVIQCGDCGNSVPVVSIGPALFAEILEDCARRGDEAAMATALYQSILNARPSA